MIISGDYPAGYTLAAGGYLSITTTGSIGGTGLTVRKDATVVSRGKIFAANGSQNTYGGTGATGVQLTSADVMTNYGTIRGGAGGSGYKGGGQGGVGAEVTLGALINNGAISGGQGGDLVGHGFPPGGGGAGVAVAGGTLINSGTITGGAGGLGGLAGSTSAGGIGVQVSKGSLTNSGVIVGGAGASDGYYSAGGAGGGGVVLGGGGQLNNTGAITGGQGGFGTSGGLTYVYGTPGYPDTGTYVVNGGDPGGVGGAGVVRTGAGTVVNSGTIGGGTGGRGGYYSAGGAGGSGVALIGGGSVVNSATIFGGDGGAVDYGGTSSAGGDGVYLGHLGGVDNQGVIVGGDGGESEMINIYGISGPGPDTGGAGGSGVVLAGVGTILNSATILGGLGGEGYDVNSFAGQGGAGAVLEAGGEVSNLATISGGQGGKGPFEGGYGGDGVLLTSGGTVVNSGTINGGQGGAGVTSQDDGGGGYGVHLTHGGVVDNLGTIIGGYDTGLPGRYAYGVVLVSGGVVNNGNTSNHSALISGVYVRGNVARVTNYGTLQGRYAAVRFDSADDTLVEESSGDLIGGAFGGGGKLELGAATGAGTISGLGGEITHFKTVTVDAGAGWTLAGANTLVAGETLSNASAIDVDGVLTNDGVIHASALIGLATGGELDNAAGGSLFLDGDVSIAPAAGATGTSFVNAGLLQKQGGTGTSSIRVSLTDTGHIAVLSGVLDLDGGANTVAGLVSGGGTIDFHTGATTLEAGAAITTAALEITGVGASLTVGTNIAFSHTFTAASGTTLDLGAGDVLSLAGAANFTGDTVEGAGRLVTKGASILASVTLGGTAEWINAGTLEAAGKVTIGDVGGDAAEFFNQAGGVFDMTGVTSIAVGTAATSRFVNAGLLEKTGQASATSIAVNVLNSGTIQVASGTLDLTGAITGAGSLAIGSGTTLEIASTVAAGQTASFDGGTLQLNSNTGFAGKVSGFAAGDTIDLRGVHSAAGETVGYSGTATSGTLTVTSGSQSAKVQLLGQYAAANFATSSDGHGGTDITFLATPAAAPGLAIPGH